MNSLLPLSLCFLIEPDCKECFSEFAKNGGCECMKKDSCDVSALIPEGCYQCGEKAGKFCRSQDEGK